MAEYVQWVRENHLARASRPGYNQTDLSLKDIDGWLKKVKEMQIRSIICLLNDEQLDYYQKIPGGLLAFYREQGFEVVNIPVKDPAHHSTGFAELENALDSIYAQYQSLPKPVLIHCSAGVDRTGRVIEDIQERES